MQSIQLITSEQIRAARGALHWSIGKLAEESGVSRSTLKRIESSEGVHGGTTIKVNQQIRKALEDSGRIEFPDEKTVLITTFSE